MKLYWRPVAHITEPDGRLQIEIRRSVSGAYYFEVTRHSELIHRGDDDCNTPEQAEHEAEDWYILWASRRAGDA